MSESSPSAMARARALWPRIAHVLRIIGAEIRQDRLSERAKSLTYTTVLALVPLIVLSFVVVRAFGGVESIEDNLFDALSKHMIGASSTNVLNFIREFSENFRSKTASTLSILLLVYTTTTMLTTIENALGDIWGASRRRPLARRVPNYVMMVMFGPLLVSASISLTAKFAGALEDSMSILGAAPLIEWLGAWVMPLAIDMAVLMVLYFFMTSVRVRFVPCLIGAFVAALIFELAKWGFQSYLSQAGESSYARVYGSVAAIPIFTIGIYLSWMAVLIGAEVANVVQRFRHLERKHLRAEARATTAELIGVAATVARAFQEGRGPTAFEDLGERTGISEPILKRAVGDLIAAGLLAETGDGDDTAYLPARPPQLITMREVAAVGGGLALAQAVRLGDAKAAAILGDVQQEMEAALDRRTLGMLAGASGA